MFVNFVLFVVLLNVISFIGQQCLLNINMSLRNTLKLTNSIFESQREMYVCEDFIDEKTQKSHDEMLSTIRNIIDQEVIEDSGMSQKEVSHYIDQFMREKQHFFCKIYLEIILQHKMGINTIDLKRKSREYIIRNFGFDPFDPEISGYSKSQGVAKAEQWSSNVISNRMLDMREDVDVVRNSRKDIWFYPVNIK